MRKAVVEAFGKVSCASCHNFGGFCDGAIQCQLMKSCDMGKVLGHQPGRYFKPAKDALVEKTPPEVLIAAMREARNGLKQKAEMPPLRSHTLFTTTAVIILKPADKKAA